MKIAVITKYWDDSNEEQENVEFVEYESIKLLRADIEAAESEVRKINSENTNRLAIYNNWREKLYQRESKIDKLQNKISNCRKQLKNLVKTKESNRPDNYDILVDSLSDSIQSYKNEINALNNEVMEPEPVGYTYPYSSKLANLISWGHSADFMPLDEYIEGKLIKF